MGIDSFTEVIEGIIVVDRYSDIGWLYQVHCTHSCTLYGATVPCIIINRISHRARYSSNIEPFFCGEQGPLCKADAVF